MEIQKNENEDIIKLIKEQLEQKIIDNKLNESECNFEIYQNNDIDEVKIKNNETKVLINKDLNIIQRDLLKVAPFYVLPKFLNTM